MSEDKREQQDELKVVDRRRFSADGELLPGAEDIPEEPPLAPAAKEEERPAAPQAGTSERQAYERAAGAGAKMQFEHLIMSLSTSAMLQLGVVEDPEQGRLPADLLAARQTIDLLGILEEKTRGNLSDKESKLLAQVLSELRMVYVQLSGAQRASASDNH